jgi:uncharacterized phage protein gp47/JayE
MSDTSTLDTAAKELVDPEYIRMVSTGYGITPTGFRRMRFPEIRNLIIASLQAKTGLFFETRPDSITGQFIDTFAEREAALWELCEAVYHAMYPISSFGTNLDHSVSFSGVVRQFEEKTTAFAICYGAYGTIIPTGAMIKNRLNQNAFELIDPVTIDNMVAHDVTFWVEGAGPGVVFTVIVDGVTYSYTCVGVDTNFSATTALALLLGAARPFVVTVSNSIRLYVVDTEPFSCMILPTLRFGIMGSGGKFLCETFGPLEVPTNTLNVIVSSQMGWDSVNNLVPGQTGRNGETDDELRRRYALGVYRLGAATMNAIDANLRQNIPGLLELKVFENYDDFVDTEGRFPHSIEVLAWGGDTEVIAQNIFWYKAAGIDTFGSVVTRVLDSGGLPHTIRFNRPAPIYIWVNVTVTQYDEEPFPVGAFNDIKQIVVDTGNNFGIGKDVIIQRFHGPIYSQITGIQSLDITIAGLDDPTLIPPPGAYTNTTLAVDDRSLSRFDLFRVAVNVLP